NPSLGKLCRLGLSRALCYQPRRWARLGLNLTLRRPGSPIDWRPGERGLCSAGLRLCPSIALPPSAARWHAALGRFWASPNTLGTTLAALFLSFQRPKSRG